MGDISTSKAALRATMSGRLQDLAGDVFSRAGQLIANHVQSWLECHPHLCKKKRIAVFKSFADEIDTAPMNKLLMKGGFSLFFVTPAASTDSIGATAQALAKTDIVLVPGRAFDRKGHRLGRGLGYYDRCFAELRKISPSEPRFVGLALDQQLVEEVPVECHDVVMHYICTPSLGVVQSE